MSLKREDWKRVLDQPKNLGMKAGGGTGVSAALDKVQDKLRVFEAVRTVADHMPIDRAVAQVETRANDLITALNELIAKCNETNTRHRKLFTTACEYLTGHVKPAAEHEIAEARKVLDAIHHDRREVQQSKEQITAYCKAAAASFREAKDNGALSHLLDQFISGVKSRKGTFEKAKSEDKYNSALRTLERVVFRDEVGYSIQNCMNAAQSIEIHY